MFADMRAAYDKLPKTMKDRLFTLVGLHGRSTGPAGEKLYGDDKGKTEKVYHEVQRPAVIEHPVTGRPILFVNPMHTHGFTGMTREEAWPLIEELAEHATQDCFVYYHHWRVGDVLMWDELATMHRGAGDYRPDERRVPLTGTQTQHTKLIRRSSLSCTRRRSLPQKAAPCSPICAPPMMRYRKR